MTMVDRTEADYLRATRSFEQEICADEVEAEVVGF